ncbi:LysM peptidoglycan-binding domain-containing protein [Bacillus sp. CGMCC 1.16541]|uniref:LysM peptidoglycan-binding domain-containing protein n=1 Tax=Bacillus sp. CGMCC 1.16541 TaxID=2185143 RepID=UPI0013A5B9B0|nr:LysM peptidoglycan-binding domain-containing protein [Bacillus sp. CGMCC 1.16541]
MTEITMTRKEAIAQKQVQKRKQKMRKVTTAACVAVISATFMNVSTSQASACSDTYTIKSGDTLYGLSKKYNVTVHQLKEVNGLQSDFIREGMALSVPAAHLSDKNEVMNTVPIYTVEAGDTLWALAKRFGTTVNIIKHTNKMNNDYVIIGQKLTIPVQAKKESFTTIGAVDRSTIEVVNKCGEPVVLKVPFGKALEYQALSGKEITITYTSQTLAVLSVQ